METEQQRLLHGERFCQQSIMLPHDIVASVWPVQEVFHEVFLGVPGQLEAYWASNLDLFFSLDMPDLEAWLALGCWHC